MMTQITMAGGNTPTLDPVTLIRMFAFRHKIFRERLGWDVTSDHGMEYDCWRSFRNKTQTLLLAGYFE